MVLYIVTLMGSKVPTSTFNTTCQRKVKYVKRSTYVLIDRFPYEDRSLSRRKVFAALLIRQYSMLYLLEE